MSTKIITTLGPASGNAEVLKYFKEHSVEIARLNGSHGIIDEHLRIAKLASDAGLDLMLDLPGPKIRLGEIQDKAFTVKTGEKVIIEKEKKDKKESNYDKNKDFKVLPCQFAIEKSTKINDIVYIDDGKIQFRVLNVEENGILAEALNNGPVKSHKGINLPCKSIIKFKDKMHLLVVVFFEMVKSTWIFSLKMIIVFWRNYYQSSNRSISRHRSLKLSTTFNV